MRFLLLTGSRDLDADVPGLWGWVRLEIRTRLLLVDRAMTGDARGPDRETHAVASTLGVEVDRYALSGAILNNAGEVVARWTKDAPPARGDAGGWRSWCLRRDRVMVKHAKRRVDEGHAVECLALFASELAAGGTKYTADYAQSLQIPVTRLVAPREYAR